MGTRSYIGIERDDGSVTYIYCHWDGYPSHNGAVLLEHYSDAERLDRLLALGDISSLAARLDPTQTSLHGFGSDSEDGVVVAYHRERGEKWDGVKPKEAASMTDIPQNHGAQFIYVWRPADASGDRVASGICKAHWMYASQDWSEVDQDLPYEEQKRPTWAWQRLTPEACKEATR